MNPKKFKEQYDGYLDSLSIEYDKHQLLMQDIFLELLRSYHNGIGVTHAAEPQIDVAHNLAKEAYFMVLEYKRTIVELEKA